jgi:hypothetical protein
VRILVNCSVLNVDSAEPIAWNAEFEGAKIVTSRSESTALTRLADVRAPAREVRFAATAVEETGSGIVRTRSIMWMTPPVKFRFCSNRSAMGRKGHDRRSYASDNGGFL